MRKFLYWAAIVLAEVLGAAAIVVPVIWAATGGDDETSTGEAWVWAVVISIVALVLMYGGYLGWRRQDKMAGWVLIISAAVLGVLTFWSWVSIPLALVIIAGGVVLLTGGPGRTPGDTIGRHGYIEPPV